MNNHTSQHNNSQTDARTDRILDELAKKPHDVDVSHSFREAMDSVTKLPEYRIPTRTHGGFKSINLYIMHNVKKMIGVYGGALTLVLLVGYFTVFQGNSNEYEDIFAAALDEPGSYVIDFEIEDNFSDIEEDEIEVDDIVVSESAKVTSLLHEVQPDSGETIDSSQSSNNITEEMENTLIALDALFVSDDIDDSELEAWFSDISAGDVLTKTYEI